jgi:hypothetical protein
MKYPSKKSIAMIPLNIVKQKTRIAPLSADIGGLNVGSLDSAVSSLS